MAESVGFVSLGCAKNLVNTEQMIFLLREAGYSISEVPDQVDLAVINTCGFIEAAKSEAIEQILLAAQSKAEGRVGKLLVTGCLSQRYRDEISSRRRTGCSEGNGSACSAILTRPWRSRNGC